MRTPQIPVTSSTPASGAPTKPSPGYAGSPTESTLLSRQGKPEVDPIHKAVSELMGAITRVRSVATVIERKRNDVMNAADRRHSRDAPDHCRACHKPVKVGASRRGFCDSCRKGFDVWRNVLSNRTEDIALDRTVYSAQHKRFAGHQDSACPQCVIDNYREVT